MKFLNATLSASIEELAEKPVNRSIPLLIQALTDEDSDNILVTEVNLLSKFWKFFKKYFQTTFLLKVLLLTTFICLFILVAYQIYAHRRTSARVVYRIVFKVFEKFQNF